MVTEIPLSKGYVALIDDEDVDLVLGFNPKWHVRVKDGRTGYAVSYIIGTGGDKSMLMHRLILSAPAKIPVDHIDRNGLNNTRGNLRLAYGSINQINTTRPSQSGYRGVLAYKGNWRATIRPASGKREKFHLGTFSTAEDAALAYDFAARHYHGEYAVLNFPDRNEPLPNRIAFPYPHRPITNEWMLMYPNH